MPAIEKITAGVDWITATLPEWHTEKHVLAHYAYAGLKAMESEGYELIERKLQGYEGWSCGNCFLGHRDDGTMAQFSGRHADDVYDRLMEANPNITRIDIQVSVQYDVMPGDVARKAYKQSKRRADRDPEHRRRKIYITVGSDAGETCYIGAPGAKERGVVYNKEVQSEEPDYARTWRWEVRFKDDAGDRVTSVLGSQNDGFRARCVSIVATWLKERGVSVDWGDYATELVLPPEKTLPTDIERKLQWLARQVRPTIAYLQGQGFSDTILVVLGFSSPLEPSGFIGGDGI